MTLTQEAVKALVDAKKAAGMSCKDIEGYFKECFNKGLINVDLYTTAIVEIYSCDTNL